MAALDPVERLRITEQGLLDWQLVSRSLGGYTIRAGCLLCQPYVLGALCDRNPKERMRYAPLRQLTRRDILSGTIATPFLTSRRAKAMEPAGTVEALRGEATAQSGSDIRSLAQNASLFVGDWVVTGMQSGIAMRLGTATEVRLRIDRFLVKAGGVLELAKGAMLFDHDPTAGPSEMAVRSTFGLIAVRGTRFFAGPSNNVFGVFLYSGELLVVGTNTAVQLQPAFGTDIAAPGEEPTPPHRWAEVRIRAAAASVM